jgi:sodium/potassium/calcium exchanger 6
VLRDLTIPTLNNDNWSKFHAMAHPIIDPLFVASLFGFAHDSVGGIPVPIVCLLISIVPTGAIYVLTHHNRAPTGVIFTVTWTLSAFFMCVVWIYVLAGELITCLSALGNIMGIPPAFLGLTVLAWGNSMGDFFTNTSVAQQGFGEMALAGCYGGPVFNILMGLSSALAFASLQTYPNAYPVKLDAACILSIVFLYISLLSTIVIVTLNNFKIDRKFGIYLLSLYAVYSVCQLMLVFL